MSCIKYLILCYENIRYINTKVPHGGDMKVPAGVKLLILFISVMLLLILFGRQNKHQENYEFVEKKQFML